MDAQTAAGSMGSGGGADVACTLRVQASARSLCLYTAPWFE